MGEEGCGEGGPGQRRPVFCRMQAAHLSASVFWDMGPPHAPTPGIVKDAGVRASKAGHWRQNMFLGRRGSCVSQLTQPSVA